MPNRKHDHETVREVKLENVNLTVHIPTDFEDIHSAIEGALGARHIDDYDIVETYEIEEY